MKCPSCGYWNKSEFPRCFRCGAPLSPPAQEPADRPWEQSLRDAEPDVSYERYDDDENVDVLDARPAEEEAPSDDATQLAGEIEQLKERRVRGEMYLDKMRRRARAAQESLRTATVIRPLPEEPDDAPPQEEEPLEERRARKERAYARAMSGGDLPPEEEPERHGVTDDDFDFDDADESAPIFYDGYESPADETDPGAYTDYQPTRNYRDTRTYSSTAIRNYAAVGARNRRPHSRRRLWPKVLVWLGACLAVMATSYFGVSLFLSLSGLSVQQEIASQVTIEEGTVQEQPGHIITISGREGAQIYVRELQNSYVVTDGVATIAIPDYYWYENAEGVTGDTMDVELTPFIKYNDGDQDALSPIRYTISVPLSPITLVRPETTYAEVSTSIYEIRLQVEKGSTVIIDGTNVSDQINNNGIVSSNVQVQPTGENRIQVSVRSRYCRENNIELILNRPEQDISLEFAVDTLVESSSAYTRIYATTFPGATVTVESPYSIQSDDEITRVKNGEASFVQGGDIVVDESGSFSFVAYFPEIGDNTITIRAQYPGRQDAVVTHVMYYMPPVDVYSRKAWPFTASDYRDLINNIANRQGQIYVCKGTITRIVSTQPQLAIMDTGTDGVEQLVMLENSSATQWELGTWYRIYGDANGMYSNMPRITARYTYTD